MPRQHTKGEMIERLLDHLLDTAEYWANADLYDEKDLSPNEKLQHRIHGAIFSTLVALDGGSTSLPAFHIVPDPHITDPEYLKEQGLNWWPVSPKEITKHSINNDIQLHEQFQIRKTKKQ
jgi:hypothetical protein